MQLLFLAAIFQFVYTSLAQIDVAYVANLKAYENDYGAEISTPGFQNHTLYVIQDSGTFLARKNSSIVDTNLDNIQLPSRWWLKWWPYKPSEKISEFIEVKFSNYSVSEYAGYVPVSACQSQERGEVGAISFLYLLTTGAREFGKVATSVNYWILSLQLLLQIDLTRATTNSEVSECIVKAGTTGQLLSKPIIAQFGMLQRTLVWDLTNQRFKRASDFVKAVDNSFIVADANIYCASSDVVNLFCDDTLHSIDWNNPREISLIAPKLKNEQHDGSEGNEAIGETEGIENKVENDDSVDDVGNRIPEDLLEENLEDVHCGECQNHNKIEGINPDGEIKYTDDKVYSLDDHIYRNISFESNKPISETAGYINTRVASPNSIISASNQPFNWNSPTLTDVNA